MYLRLHFPPENLNLFMSANLDGKLKEFQKYSGLVKKVALMLQFFLQSVAVECTIYVEIKTEFLQGKENSRLLTIRLKSKPKKVRKKIT